MLANLFLFILNLTSLVVALFVGDYEIAKLTKPGASWYPTSTTLDLTIVGFIVGLASLNLAVLVFVILRGLVHHRHWLWWTTGASVLLVGLLWYILGPYFLSILWPTF